MGVELMNWENILKVQVLGSKQRVKQGIRPLPKEEKTNCKDTLRQWHKNAYDTQTKIWEIIRNLEMDILDTNLSPEIFEPTTFNEVIFEKIPEEVACKIIEIINHFMDGNERFTSKYITWAEPDGSNRKFEVSLTYYNNEHLSYGNTNLSAISIWFHEIFPHGERSVISLIRIKLPKSAYDAHGGGEDFEEYDIKELDFRR